MLKSVLLRLFFIILSIFFCVYQTSPLYSQVLVTGEELNYEVSFMGIKLGSIRVINEGIQDVNGKKTSKTKSYMDSYRGIPFVSLHATFDSWLDQSSSNSHKFAGSSKRSDNLWDYEKIAFDYINGKISFEQGTDGKPQIYKTFITQKKYNDGLSLFYFARQFTNSNRFVKIPTIMNGDTCYTFINFKGKRENIEVESINYPVRTIYFNGKAEWTGVYGVTGEFEGWFSDDDARIPILAKMKTYLGNADIKLLKWKRKNWTPPKG